jgi:Tfp pilus assembly protein PilN
MKYYINLFPQKEKDLVDRITYFAFHYLRYILVITQFVVICVFFFRFKVDQEIVDLKDGLQQKRQIIVATSGLLEQVEALDEKTKTVKEIVDEQERFAAMYSYFVDSIPPEVVITALTFNPDTIHCEGYARNPGTIQDLRLQLEREKRFETIDLSNIRKSEEGFTFTLDLADFTTAVAVEPEEDTP